MENPWEGSYDPERQPGSIVSWQSMVLDDPMAFLNRLAPGVKQNAGQKKKNQRPGRANILWVVKAKQTARHDSIPVQKFLAAAICHPGNMGSMQTGSDRSLCYNVALVGVLRQNKVQKQHERRRVAKVETRERIGYR